MNCGNINNEIILGYDIIVYGVIVGVGIGIMFQPLVVACGALAIIGFKASGVLAGAITAAAQSSIANVTTGSLFASK